MLLGIIILGLLALVAARLDRVSVQRAAGAVIVNDGDTITLGGQRVRLRGIDSPELDQTCIRAGETYPCGREAKSALRALIGDGPVVCEGWERDRYGRLLGDCKSADVDLNQSLVSQGWAVAFGEFEAEEEAAERASRGLWAGEFDRPRHWRNAHGSLAESDHDALGAIFNWARAILGL